MPSGQRRPALMRANELGGFHASVCRRMEGNIACSVLSHLPVGVSSYTAYLLVVVDLSPWAGRLMQASQWQEGGQEGSCLHHPPIPATYLVRGIVDAQ